MAPTASVKKRVGDEEALLGRVEESCLRFDWKALLAV
jgi:hypothetical protein